MKIEAVCEYNDGGYLFYAANYPGAFVRGASEAMALAKFGGEIRSFLRWSGEPVPRFDEPEIVVVQRKRSELQICDADSDVLFDSERRALPEPEYEHGKALMLKSARGIQKLFGGIPNPDISDRAPRTSFYGPVPRTPREMYRHINDVTAYYAAAVGIGLENVPDLYLNRLQVLSELEALPDFLSARVYTAPDGELWTMRKVIRRFLWHDRIHARAMWRTATSLWGRDEIPNPFFFV